MAAVLIAMALTPGELSHQLFWGVVSLGVAVGAFLLVDGQRKSRTARGVGPVAPSTDGRS